MNSLQPIMSLDRLTSKTTLQILTTVLKIQVFGDITPCSLVNRCRRFGVTYCRYLQTLLRSVGKYLQEVTSLKTLNVLTLK